MAHTYTTHTIHVSLHRKKMRKNVLHIFSLHEIMICFPKLSHNSLRTQTVSPIPYRTVDCTERRWLSGDRFLPLSICASLAASISLPPTAPSVPLNLHSPTLPVVSIAAKFSGPLSLCYRTYWQQHGCSRTHSLFRALIILPAPAVPPFSWASASLRSGLYSTSFSQSLLFPRWWFYSHLCCQPPFLCQQLPIPQSNHPPALQILYISLHCST